MVWMPVRAASSLTLTSPAKRYPPRAGSELYGSSLSSLNSGKIPQFYRYSTRNSPADIKVKLYLSRFISRSNITWTLSVSFFVLFCFCFLGCCCFFFFCFVFFSHLTQQYLKYFPKASWQCLTLNVSQYLRNILSKMESFATIVNS